jgi:hypothetical protein
VTLTHGLKVLINEVDPQADEADRLRRLWRAAVRRQVPEPSRRSPRMNATVYSTKQVRLAMIAAVLQIIGGITVIRAAVGAFVNLATILN